MFVTTTAILLAVIVAVTLILGFIYLVLWSVKEDDPADDHWR